MRSPPSDGAFDGVHRHSRKCVHDPSTQPVIHFLQVPKHQELQPLPLPCGTRRRCRSGRKPFTEPDTEDVPSSIQRSPRHFVASTVLRVNRLKSRVLWETEGKGLVHTAVHREIFASRSFAKLMATAPLSRIISTPGSQFVCVCSLCKRSQ
jgi:hypothetical protein